MHVLVVTTFVCNNGNILAADMHCDGYPNCLDGEDEQNCPIEDDLDETTGTRIRLIIKHMYM